MEEKNEKKKRRDMETINFSKAKGRMKMPLKEEEACQMHSSEGYVVIWFNPDISHSHSSVTEQLCHRYNHIAL